MLSLKKFHVPIVSFSYPPLEIYVIDLHKSTKLFVAVSIFYFLQFHFNNEKLEEVEVLLSGY